MLSPRSKSTKSCTNAPQRSVSEFEFYYQDQSESADRYYADYAQRYIRPPKAVKWNWAAFLFSEIWLLARKGYRAFLASWAGLIVASAPLILGIIAFAPSLEWAFGIALGYRFFVQVLWGFFGNNLYFWDMTRRMQAGSQARGMKIMPALGIIVLICLLWEALRYFFSS